MFDKSYIGGLEGKLHDFKKLMGMSYIYIIKEVEAGLSFHQSKNQSIFQYFNQFGEIKTYLEKLKVEYDELLEQDSDY